MDKTNTIIARIAGAILLLFGSGMLVFFSWALVTQLTSGETLNRVARILIAAGLGLGTVFSIIGFRLAVNRPNKYQSILPPAGWYVMSVVFAAIAATFGILLISRKGGEHVSGVLSTGLFAWWCWTAGKHARARASGVSMPADDPWGGSANSRGGYFRLMTLRGIPVFIHVSLPLGGILFSAYAGFDYRNTIYYCAGYVLLVGAHEAGHALAARLCGIKVSAVEISGVGGLCRIETPRRVSHGVIVYSAGIVVQLVISGLTLAYTAVAGQPTSRFGQSLVTTFTIVNAIVLLLNLLPIRMSGLATDGRVLWQLLQFSLGKQPYPFPHYALASAEQAPVFPPQTRLLTKPVLVPKEFKQGIEILNDSKTPMDLVIVCLMRHLGLQEEVAFKTMVDIHNQGGVLIELPSRERAEAVAAAITAEAKQYGHELICRAVDATAEMSSAAQESL